MELKVFISELGIPTNVYMDTYKTYRYYIVERFWFHLKNFELIEIYRSSICLYVERRIEYKKTMEFFFESLTIDSISDRINIKDNTSIPFNCYCGILSDITKNFKKAKHISKRVIKQIGKYERMKYNGINKLDKVRF